MADCGTSDSMLDVFCRLNKGLRVLNRFKRIKEVERTAQVDVSDQFVGDKLEGYDEFKRVYPDAAFDNRSPRFENDKTLFKRYLLDATGFIAENQLNRMKAIVAEYEYRYLASEGILTALALSVRAWLPFVSHASFVSLTDQQDVDEWNSSIPTDPPPLESLPEANGQEPMSDASSNDIVQTETSDKAVSRDEPEYSTPDDLLPLETLPEEDIVTEEALSENSGLTETSDRAQKAPSPEEKALSSYTPWRFMTSEDRADSPRRRALKNKGFESDNELRDFLYANDPILILLPKFASPLQLLKILKSDPADREKSLRALAVQAIAYLRKGQEAFEEDIRPIIDYYKEQRTMIPDDVPWQRLTPIRKAAKVFLILGANFAENSPLYKYAGQVFEDLEPITLEDKIGYALFGVSIIATVLTAGTALPVTVTVFIDAVATTIDLAGFAVSTYVKALENEERGLRNRFVSVDAALEVASPQINLATDAAFLAASYLIPAGIGQAGKLLGNIKRTPARGARTGAADQASQRFVPPQAANDNQRFVRPRPANDNERMVPTRAANDNERMIPPKPANDNERLVPPSPVNDNQRSLAPASPRGASQRSTSANSVNTTAQRTASTAVRELPGTNMRLNETAGTGGIHGIRIHRDNDGSLDVLIKGELLDPIPRAQAPNFNNRLPTGSQIDPALSEHQLLHLWGPGFGDEAFDGIMYAHRDVNLRWQNSGIEDRLRQLHELAKQERARILVDARAKSYPDNFKGHMMLKKVEYKIKVQRSDGTEDIIGEVSISVSPPPQSRVTEVDIRGGSSGPWSLQ